MALHTHAPSRVIFISLSLSPLLQSVVSTSIERERERRKERGRERHRTRARATCARDDEGGRERERSPIPKIYLPHPFSLSMTSASVPARPSTHPKMCLGSPSSLSLPIVRRADSAQLAVRAEDICPKVWIAAATAVEAWESPPPPRRRLN